MTRSACSLSLSLVLALTGSFACALGACTEETITLATLPAEDAGVPMRGVRCTVAADCPPDNFCEKEACDAPAGTCRRRPTLCAPESRPSCGCDGITYLDDCTRRSAGVASSSPGECDVGARRCGPGAPCPDGATCALLVTNRDQMCGPEAGGVCWGLPAVCPPASSTERWDACLPGGPRCFGTCEAIAAGVPFRRAGRCP
jgi:hypothetical protein